jgi:hypothetical protein
MTRSRKPGSSESVTSYWLASGLKSRHQLCGNLRVPWSHVDLPLVLYNGACHAVWYRSGTTRPLGQGQGIGSV